MALGDGMSEQHTPGPWSWMLMGETTRTPLHVLESPYKDVVLTVKDAEFGPTTNPEANRRLIAAAPDLLDLVRRISQWDSLDGAADGPFWKRECQRAIAKATGREP